MHAYQCVNVLNFYAWICTLLVCHDALIMATVCTCMCIHERGGGEWERERREGGATEGSSKVILCGPDVLINWSHCCGMPLLGILLSLQCILYVKISNCGQPDNKISDMGHSWSRKSKFSLSLPLPPSLSLSLWAAECKSISTRGSLKTYLSYAYYSTPKKSHLELLCINKAVDTVLLCLFLPVARTLSGYM